MAAVGAGGDGEFDEHVVLVGGAVVLADGEAGEVGFYRLGLGDAGVVWVDGCACCALCWRGGAWCCEDGCGEEGEGKGEDGFEVHD